MWMSVVSDVSSGTSYDFSMPFNQFPLPPQTNESAPLEPNATSPHDNQYPTPQMNESVPLDPNATSLHTNQLIPAMYDGLVREELGSKTMHDTSFAYEELGSNTGMETIHLDSNPSDQMETPKALIATSCSVRPQKMENVSKKGSPIKKSCSPKAVIPKMNKRIEKKKAVKKESSFLNQITNSASDLIKTALTNAMVGATGLVGADGIFEDADNNKTETNEQVTNMENNMIVPFGSNQQDSNEQENNMIIPFESNLQVTNFDHEVFLWNDDNNAHAITTTTEDLSSPTSSKRSRPIVEDSNDNLVQYKTRKSRAKKATTIIPYSPVPDNIGVRRRRT